MRVCFTVPIRVVLDSPAAAPAWISTLSWPVVRFAPALKPTAVLNEPVLFASAPVPSAVLPLPVSLFERALLPSAVLVPVPVFEVAPEPVCSPPVGEYTGGNVS